MYTQITWCCWPGVYVEILAADPSRPSATASAIRPQTASVVGPPGEKTILQALTVDSEKECFEGLTCQQAVQCLTILATAASHALLTRMPAGSILQRTSPTPQTHTFAVPHTRCNMQQQNSNPIRSPFHQPSTATPLCPLTTCHSCTSPPLPPCQ